MSEFIIRIILAFVGLIIALVLLDETFDVLNVHLRDPSILAFCGSSICGIMHRLTAVLATMQVIFLVTGSFLVTTAGIQARGGIERIIASILIAGNSLFAWLDQFRKMEISEVS